MSLVIFRRTKFHPDRIFYIFFTPEPRHDTDQEEHIRNVITYCFVATGNRNWRILLWVKKNGMFLYSSVSTPLDRSKRFTFHTPPSGRPVHSDTNSAFLRSILAMQQLRVKTIHSHFHQVLSKARNSFKNRSELRCRRENENAQTLKR